MLILALGEELGLLAASGGYELWNCLRLHSVGPSTALALALGNLHEFEMSFSLDQATDGA